METIQLGKRGKNKGKYVALVDDEDFEKLNQFNWYAHKDCNTFYAGRHITVDGKRTTQLMHNVILNGKGIDHRDGNGCNNQKTNLRLCTNQENCMNQRKQTGTSSIYKGVSLFKRDNKWQASIMLNGKKIYLGLFNSEIEAAKAYNDKAVALFCEFANLNNFNELSE